MNKRELRGIRNFIEGIEVVSERKPKQKPVGKCLHNCKVCGFDDVRACKDFVERAKFSRYAPVFRGVSVVSDLLHPKGEIRRVVESNDGTLVYYSTGTEVDERVTSPSPKKTVERYDSQKMKLAFDSYLSALDQTDKKPLELTKDLPVINGNTVRVKDKLCLW